MAFDPITSSFTASPSSGRSPLLVNFSQLTTTVDRITETTTAPDTITETTTASDTISDRDY